MKRLAVFAALWGGAALADTPVSRPTAIELDRDDTIATRPELGFDGGAPLGGGWAIGIGGGWLERPITFVTSTGETHPVERRETMSLSASVALGESVVLDARLPFAHQVGDRLQGIGFVDGGNDRALDRWVLADLALALRLRVVGRPAWSVFARGELTLPTGDSGDFAGESSWTLGWALIARGDLPHGVTLAAQGGLRIRGDEVQIADRVATNELTGAAGIAIAIPPIHPLWCVADQVKLTAEIEGALGDQVGSRKGPSPVEARIGLVTKPVESVTLGFRVGAGLVSDEIGAPAWRAMVTATFVGSAQLTSLLPATERDDESSEEDVSD
ncbi:MAG TPA: hypothetical protein VGM90_18465 [Kofleriaceae bacterium]|jgi:hypothetical protein